MEEVVALEILVRMQTEKHRYTKPISESAVEVIGISAGVFTSSRRCLKTDATVSLRGMFSLTFLNPVIRSSNFCNFWTTCP